MYEQRLPLSSVKKEKEKKKQKPIQENKKNASPALSVENAMKSE